ncbi:MAG: prepilin-type N-terminal cleavage/methylation domain-containing protein [bacterium]|nr:prepilin-type N-terminal cleavage/methylation domain-containing protein [bacterium]
MQKLLGKKSFTIMELLVVIAILGIVLATYPLTTNFNVQIAKGKDARRKTDLASLKHILEDFYNDNNRYPLPSEVCYDSLSGSSNCHICGDHPASPGFVPYAGKLPCDPQSRAKEYRYLVSDPLNPTWYRIYTELSNKDDTSIAEVGCSSGCGPTNGYNYGISSGNTGL